MIRRPNTLFGLVEDTPNVSPIRSTTDSATCASQPLEPNSTEQIESSAFKTASEVMWESIMDRMKFKMKAAASKAVTQATARRVSPSPSPKLSSYRSKTRTQQSFVMTESENEHSSENEAVAQIARRKCPMQFSPKQSRTIIRTKPKSSVKKRLRWTKSSARNDSFDNSSSDTETSERRPKKPKPPSEWDSSSSSDTESHVRTEKPKHLIKPPMYNGTSSFETFLAQFRNSLAYNHWTKDEQLVYLRSSLENEAGQVLWDYDAEEINSAGKLIRVLTKRFGGTEQADKYRLEVKYRRQKPGESLRMLHAEIRKLVASAFPKLQHKARELMACDYFIDSLNDPNRALKVRERSPKDLDSALKIALQLEVWANDAERTKREQQPKEPPQ